MTAAHRPDGHPVVLVTKQRLWRLHARLQQRVPLWTVYRPGTREYPGYWVARMHLVLPEYRVTRFVTVHHTLQDLRQNLPPGLTQLPRQPNDAPEIEETWV